jgi:tripartite-type tricarboxylate transporter receptor subunit TctC
MSINRTHLSACASALAAACLLAAGPAHADWQPTKTVEIVVAAGAGGGTDQLPRLIQPLCVFSKTRMSYTTKVADKSWSEIATCKEQGLAITQTSEFAQYVERNALAPTFLEGAALVDYIKADVARAHGVFQDAGWLVK